jgi:hypothetical protein
MDEEKAGVGICWFPINLLISYHFSGIKAHLKIAETSELTKLFERFLQSIKQKRRAFLDSLTFRRYT